MNNINYKNIKFYKPLINDFIDQSNSIKELISEHQQNFKKTIENKKITSEQREALVNAIKKQYLSAKIEVPDILDELLKDNVYTVTTGHQLNLFGGPLFFAYKILETIKLAEELNAKENINKVYPVFWMATEDHDFEEINFVNVYGKKIKWETNQSGAVGRFIIDESFLSFKSEFLELIKEKPFFETVEKLINESYIMGDNLSNCTRKFVSKLFKDYELIIVDGDDEKLKQSAKNIFDKELSEQITYRQVAQANSYLEKKGYHSQVYVRDINLFYLTENKRERVEKEGDEYFVLVDSKKKFSKNELLERISKISPNALLRPLYQEAILPNLAYIGGAGEIAYWMQLKGVFDKMEIDFPTIIVRNSLMYIDTPTKNKIEKIGLPIEEYFSETEQLKANYIKSNVKEDLNLSVYINEFSELFDRLKNFVAKHDKNIENKAAAIKFQHEKSLIDLEKRLIKSQKDQFDSYLNQIDKIKEKLIPENSIQERKESLLFFYSIYGQEFLNQVQKAIIPFDNSIKIVSNE